MHFLRTWYGLAILSAVLLTTFSPSSWAHAKLQKSVPTAEAVMKESPKNIRLEFNEKLEKSFSSIFVNDIKKQMISTEKAVLDPSDQKVMTLTLPVLSPGRYQVNWTAVTVDGHRVKGSYIFSIVR